MLNHKPHTPTSLMSIPRKVNFVALPGTIFFFFSWFANSAVLRRRRIEQRKEKKQQASNPCPMSREFLCYGNKILLFCESRRGFVVGTNSALAPLGVRPNTKEDPLRFERAVFMILPGDGEWTGAANHDGEEVKFGQVVRLIHTMHQKPMAQHVNLHAMVNKANQRVTLEKTGGSTSGSSAATPDVYDRWRIMPRYRLRGEGERVCSTDHVVFQSVSGEVAFLHVSSTRDATADGCFEVNCGTVAEGFEVRLFDADDAQDTRALRGGQCVALFHKQEGRGLSVDPRSGMCMLDPVDQPDGAGGDHDSTTAAATHLQASSSSARAHSYKSLFILEFADPQRGGMIECGRRSMYRLKALCNGQYLCVASEASSKPTTRNAEAENRQHQQYLDPQEQGLALSDGDVRIIDVNADAPNAPYELTLSPKSEDPGTLFVFHQGGDDQSSTLRDGCRVFLEAPMVGSGGLWIVAGDPIEARHLRELLSAPTSDQKPLRIGCREEKSMRDGMQVHRLPNDEYEELSIVLSLLPPLQAHVDAMNAGVLESSLVQQVLENVRQLRRLCFSRGGGQRGGGGGGGSSVPVLSAGSEVDGVINAVGQLRLLRQGVPHMCIEILRATLESPLIDTELLNSMEEVRTPTAFGGDGDSPAAPHGAASSPMSLRRRESHVGADGAPLVKYADVLDLLNSSFSLILAVVRGQPSHARELSLHLQFLVSCCRVLPSSVECVAEFYRNNLQLVKTPGDTKSLHFFLDMLADRGRDTSILEIVTLFAMCGDDGIVESQQLIVDRLLRHKEMCKALMLPVTTSGDVLHVGVPVSYGSLPHERALPTSEDNVDTIAMIPIIRLKDVVGSAYTQHGRNRPLPYFTQQILLLAAVCAGRNSSSTLAVQQLIPPELMLPLLECEGMAPELHAAFVRLFTLSLVEVAGSPDLFERTRSIRHVIDEPRLTESYSLEEEVPGILVRAKKFALRYLHQQGAIARNDAAHVLELDSVAMLTASLLKRGSFALDEYTKVVSVLTEVLRCDQQQLPTSADGDLVQALRHVLGILGRLADFLLTRDVFDVVTSFVRGMPLRHLSQFHDLSPTSTINEKSKKRVKTIGADAMDTKLNDLFSLGQASAGLAEFDRLADLLMVLMVVSRTESWDLRSDAIRLFCRLTNYPGELLVAVCRVQLLTSAASAEFYGRVKLVAVELDAFSRLPLSSSTVHMGEAALGRIEKLLTERDCGAMIEKIAMLRHAEVPQMLLHVLHAMPTPPKEDVRLFVFNIVGLLQTMGQEPLVLELLASSIPSFVHLTTHDVDVLSLIRTIYCGKPLMAMQVPIRVVREVVACLSLDHSAAHALQLLRELIATKDPGGKYIAKNQRAVWKALVADQGSAKLLRLRGSWTGRRGTARRDQLLQSEEYFNHSGPLRLHVSLMEVLFLTAKTNELVKAEEIRDELFGPNSVDELIEIVTNLRLPAFYRFRFINVLQVTVVQDAACVSSLFSHRLFPEFLKLCRIDVNRCLLLVDGKCNDPADAEMVEQLDRDILRRRPSTQFEEAIEQRRTSLDFYLEHVVLGIIPCIKHLMDRFVKGTARLHQTVRQQLVARMNELMDCICDLLRQVFVLASFHDYNFFQARITRKKPRDFLIYAGKNGFSGTGRWGDDIQALAEAIPLEDKDSGEEHDKAHSSTADEKALTSKWLGFVRKHLQDGRPLDPDRLYASGAGLILRSGGRGTQFVRKLILSLRDLPVLEQSRVLDLLRQVVNVREDDEADDSVLLRLDMCSVTTDDDDDSSGLGILGVLTLNKQMDDRQEILASYFADQPHVQVLPAVTQILSRGTGEARAAALRCALVLLEGGHRKMQESLCASAAQRSDEDLFIVMRSRMQQCRDALRSYRYAMRRGAKEEAVMVLGPLDTIVKELRYIQLLCEGHFEELQHYLRRQPDNHVSVNVLESLVELLEVVVSIIDANTYELTMQLLATITETIQGPCKSNQDFFVTVNAAEFLTALMVLPLQHATLTEVQVRAMRAQSLTVLLALIEGRMEVLFLGGLISKLDLRQMGRAMEQSAQEYEARWGPLEAQTSVLARTFGFVRRILSYVQKIYKTDDRDETEDELCVAVSIFIFFKACLDLQQLKSYAGSTHEFVDKCGQTIRDVLRQSKCYKAVNKRVGMVEILREGALERSYFRILSVSSENLRDFSKEDVIKSVDRSSDNKRLQDYFEQCNKLMMELDSYAEMQHSPLLAFIQDYASEFDVLGLMIVFTINLIMLITYKADENIYDDPVAPQIRRAVDVLAIILIVLQIMLFVNFFFGPTRVYLKGSWLRWQDSKVEELLDEHRAGLSIEPIEEDVNFLEDVTPVQYYIQSAYYILQFGKFYQLSLFLLCAVMGYVQSPIWFSIQLLQITSKSQLLYNVVLAISTNGASLLLTLVLMLCVVFVFASIAFYNFSELYSPHVSGTDGFDCDTLLQCWLIHIDGIRSGGGVGDNAAAPSFHTGGQGYSYYVFRLMFFIIIVIIFLNIVFGIIVDSFAKLREDREFVENDQVSKCFVCGVEQNEFDRVAPGGFDHHIRTEHNMWHYLFFLHYIKKKDKSNLSGQESHVWKKMKAKEPSFFPIGRAMMLQADQLEHDGEEARKLELYRSTMESIVSKYSMDVEGRIDAFGERLESVEHALLGGSGRNDMGASSTSRRSTR